VIPLYDARMQSLELIQQEQIYSVSRLNNEVRSLLEDAYAQLWVEGEISNFAAPHSGHWYFSLKDQNAQVRCAMFKGSQRKLSFLPKDGMHVLIRARVSLYENRGEYQLLADDMEERGEGKLRRAYELLKKNLEAAGLFAPEHKQVLPVFPKTIGVITSSTGAAIRDILTVLKRRYAVANVVIYPTLVQGNQAAPNIVKAIEIANQRKECEILILARGGGSLEDLWPFNEEIVAHAIFRSHLPIISGVGHEVDFTIADFVADKRAPTPSAAAEMITPDKTDLLNIFVRQQHVFMRHINHKLQAIKQLLEWTQKHLSQQHPKRQLAEKTQRLDFCELTLVQLQTRRSNILQTQLQQLAHKLQHLAPLHHIRLLQHQMDVFAQRFTALIAATINKKQTQLANAAVALDTLSPLATLKRGYAIATLEDSVLRDSKAVNIGDQINVQLMAGKLVCDVKEKIE
jgi:exodeoxyribonuclease VII large subunit